MPRLSKERDIPTDLTEIKRVVKAPCKQQCDHKLDNSDEMNKFLERHKRPKQTQE